MPQTFPATKNIGFAERPFYIYVPAFTGGWVDARSLYNLNDNELSVAQNVILSHPAPGELSSAPHTDILRVREGTTRLSTQQTEAITSIFQGTNAAYFSTSTTIRSTAGTSLDSGLTSSTSPDWTSLLDNDIFCNGTEVRTSTNGTTFAALGGSPPAFKFIQAYNNAVFGAGHNTGTLRWSDFGTVATWTATNSLTITNDQNDDITGIYKWRNTLFVFCERSFHHVKGFSSPEMAVTFSHFGDGCVSHRSITSTHDAIFWWSPRGPAMSDGFSVTYPTLDRIPRELSLGLSDADSITQAVHATVVPYNDRVDYYYINSGSTVNRRLSHYYKENVCFYGVGAGIEMGASGFYVDTNNRDIYLGGSAITTGYLFNILPTAADDDTVAITTQWRTKSFTTEYGPDSLKVLDQVSLFTESTATTATGTLRLIIDDDTGNSVSYSVSQPTTQSGLDTAAKTTISPNVRFKRVTLLFDSGTGNFNVRGISLSGRLLHL